MIRWLKNLWFRSKLCFAAHRNNDTMLSILARLYYASTTMKADQVEQILEESNRFIRSLHKKTK